MALIAPLLVSKSPSFCLMWVKLASSVNMLKESLPSSHVPCLSNFHSNYLPMIFSLWFLSCKYYSWNPLFNIFSSPFLLSFRWVSVNSVWIIPVSCELLLSPSALPFPCTSLYNSASGLKRLPPFTVICCDFDQREKAVCARRDGLHAVKYCGVLVSVGLRHMEIKVNVTCNLGLRSHVHCLSLTWSLLTLLASRETNDYCI